MPRFILSGFAILAVAVGLTGALLLNLCDGIFGCGCRSWWTGAATHCNIHEPTSPNCPWCVMGPAAQTAAASAILLPQAAMALWPGWRWPRRLVLALLAFPAAGAITGLVSGWATGYWN